MRFDFPSFASLAASLLAVALCSGAAQAAPLLRCVIEQGGVKQMLELMPVRDPYRVSAIDINGRFRFKGVVIGDRNSVDYIKLYVYASNSRQPVLVHEAKYLAPRALPEGSPEALTGMNYIYSNDLERELQYRCALLEVAQ